MREPPSRRWAKPTSQHFCWEDPHLARAKPCPHGVSPARSLAKIMACVRSSVGIPKGPRIKLLRALQRPAAGAGAVGLTPSTPVKAPATAPQPATPETPTQENIMQQLLEQARMKDEKIRKLESAALQGADRGVAASPTPPITPPQRPSQQSSAGGTSQEDFEDQASDHSSINSGFSPGGSQQSQQASQEGLSDVWGAPGWTGVDFGAELPQAPVQHSLAAADSALLARDLRGEVIWFGGEGVSYGLIGVAASSETRGPADQYLVHSRDVEASGLTTAQLKEGQRLLFDVHKRNPLEQDTSPEAVLKYVKDNRDAWIDWLRSEGLADVGNDPRRHDSATMQTFRQVHFTEALTAGDPAATEACLVAVNLRLPTVAAQPRKAAWTAAANTSASSAFGQAAPLSTSWTVSSAPAPAPAPAKPPSPLGRDDGSAPAASSIWGGNSFAGGGLWGGEQQQQEQQQEQQEQQQQQQQQNAPIGHQHLDRADNAEPAMGSGADADTEAAPVTPGSWAAKAMRPAGPAAGAWGKPAAAAQAQAQAVPDLGEAQSFPGLGPASAPQAAHPMAAAAVRRGMPSMAEVAAAAPPPQPQPAEPPSLLDMAIPKKQDKKALKKLRKQQQQAAREAEAEASRQALAAMDSDKLHADVALASLNADGSSSASARSSSGGEPKLSRRAQERLEEAEKETRRQAKEEEQLLKQRIRMAKSKGQSWSKDVLENQRHRSGASRRRMEDTEDN